MFEEFFTLEKYQTGEYDIVTKSGYPVRILCTDSNSNYPIVGLIKFVGYDFVYEWSLDGKPYNDSSLHMLLLKKKRWKPTEGGGFFFIDTDMTVEYRPYGDICDTFFNAGNCFRTEEEAEEKLKEIREILNR